MRKFPEVETVFGKAGQADTPTDPAPLSMFETVVALKPPEQWRNGHDVGKAARGDERQHQDARHGEHLLDADPDAHRDAHHRVPQRARHQSLRPRSRAKFKTIAVQIEKALSDFPDTRSVFAERTTGGYFLDFTVNREAAARYGLSVGDVNDIIETAIGGKTIATTVEGRERYPINVRYARDFRAGLDALKRVLVRHAHRCAGADLDLLADIRYKTGPPSIRNENGQLVGFVFVDITTSDIDGYVRKASQRLSQRSQVSARLLHPVGRPVRISQGGRGAAQDRGPVHAAHHFRAHLHEHEIGGENRQSCCSPCRSRLSAHSGCSTCSVTT